MLASITRIRCRRPAPFLFSPFATYAHARCYTQQRTARTPIKSAPQRTTTNPSPSSQSKNRNLPPAAAGKVLGAKKPIVEEKVFADLRKERDRGREYDDTGAQLDRLRQALTMGIEPWRSKAMLLDLRIPPKITNMRTLNENITNNMRNAISMFRLANDFAFPGMNTKWRVSPQLFRAKSTSEKAWVAPFRRDLLEVYVRINQAIASGDKKTLSKLTAYEFQSHAYTLLTRSRSRSSTLSHTFSWSLTKLLSPVRILSLRVFPLYSAPDEPKVGNRNCVQALVRFETLQTLTVRDARGRVLNPDGSAAEENYTPEPKRVLEYLVCENKMFYEDGWYVRDRMFEDVKPQFRDIEE